MRRKGEAKRQEGEKKRAKRGEGMANEAAAGGEKAAIVWKEEEGRLETEDGEAFLQYRLRRLSGGAEAMEMLHTYVPARKRGAGLAGRLCDAAFAHARRRGLRVIPTCSYISDTYLPRNTTWNSLVYKEEEAKSSL